MITTEEDDAAMYTPVSKKLIVNAVKEFLDSYTPKIKYRQRNTEPACFFEYNESQDCNVPGYEFRIMIPDLSSFEVGVVAVTAVFPLKIDEHQRLTMLELASHINDSIPIGYFHFSLDSNEFTYKNSLQFIDVIDSERLQEQIDDFWSLNHIELEAYTKCILDVVLGGVDPKTAVERSRS
jgi:hypothetical protein